MFGGIYIEENYKQQNIMIAKDIINKISYEFGGSELDLIQDTIIQVLNDYYKKKHLEMAQEFATQIVEHLVLHDQEEIKFDFVYDKIYSLFKEPLFCELVFAKVQEKLEKEHNILIEPLDENISI